MNVWSTLLLHLVKTHPAGGSGCGKDFAPIAGTVAPTGNEAGAAYTTEGAEITEIGPWAGRKEVEYIGTLPRAAVEYMGAPTNSGDSA